MITENDVKEVLKKVVDPELGIDIVKLGLIYGVTFGPVMNNGVYEWIEVLMTLTSPYCPYAEELVLDVEKAVASLQKGEARVEITFEPAWQPSEELKAELGV